MASRTATPQDLWRLAEQGERNGVKILVEPISGEHYATSGTKATILYRVTHWSCTCRGFLAWQRCQHHSLLLAELGFLGDPGPDPAAPAAGAAPIARRCWDCGGRGWEREAGASGAWLRVPCLGCGGAGTIPADADGNGDDARHSAPYDGGRRAA
jgi:hypothetical protein